MMKRSIWISLFIPLALGLFVTSQALAQEGNPQLPTDNDVNSVAKQLYCPVCENIPLDVCPTQACAQWRELIREKLALGWTDSQIKGYFVDQYGDRVLASPPARGLNLLVYIFPPLAILMGALILARALQAWKQSPPPVSLPDSPAAAGDEYVALLEEELRKR